MSDKSVTVKNTTVEVRNEIEYGMALAAYTLAGANVWPWHKGYKPLDEDQTHHLYAWDDCGFLKRSGLGEDGNGDFKSPFELIEAVKSQIYTEIKQEDVLLGSVTALFGTHVLKSDTEAFELYCNLIKAYKLKWWSLGGKTLTEWNAFPSCVVWAIGITKSGEIINHIDRNTGSSKRLFMIDFIGATRMPPRFHAQRIPYSELKPNPFGDCPLCQSKDGLSIDSSWKNRGTSIICAECSQFKFWDTCREESIIKFFKSTAITNVPKKGDRVEVVGDSGTITNAPWSNVVAHIGDNGKHYFDEDGLCEGYVLDAANLTSVKYYGDTGTTHYTYSK